MHSIVTIGDCIIDEIRFETEDPRRFAGGAGLNLAAGVAKLGLPSTLVTRVGQDRDGYYLRRYARDRAVRIINTPSVDPTGVVTSTRKNGEPSYAFGPAMFRRRILFDVAVSDALADASVVAVNSFPFDNAVQAAALAAAFQSTPRIRIVDPNPRPRLIPDIARYRQGFEALLPTASLVKLSDEDLQVLYDADWQKVASHLFELGAETLLFSHGAQGARVVERSGLAVHVPVVELPSPIVDTMGAGDATLASVIASLARNGRPQSASKWQACLSEAMVVAAATCRQAGAELVLP
ncbi:hypothetical protein GB927_024950 [Shinella sp. CPCC 100929]|uniref:Carbohydrate kinase PfkB domain-containing protein n=1 Tax=Shinella lacus TaxID=2654216 RepID=A0ABT1RDR1_9HYPH|nr:PfkB family carbohydrate kinase [Shinella lacus]MCQ4633314.1 hypothetical protein [Shinella lacus]